MIKAILFDLDNTLINTKENVKLFRQEAVKAMIREGLKARMNEALEKLNEIVKKYGSNYQHHLELLCKHFNGRVNARIVASGIVAYHNIKFGILVPNSNTNELLLELIRKGYKLALVTNGIAIKQWEKILRTGLRPFFDVVLVSNEKEKKPKDRLIMKAVKALKVKPEEALMVGDDVNNDIIPALRNGLKAVLLGNSPGKESYKFLRIKKLNELLNIVEKLNKNKK